VQSLTFPHAALPVFAVKVACRLEAALKHSNRHSELDSAFLSATALLALTPSIASNDLGSRLLRDLAAAPLHRLTPGTVRLATMGWAWVVAGSPDMLVPLVSQLVEAWVWSADCRMGLFSARQHTLDDEDGEDLDPEEAFHDEGMLAALAAHGAWLAHLSELWTAAVRLGDVRSEAVRGLYGRLLHHSLRDPSVLSSHPAALGARFRLLTLGLQYGRSLLSRPAAGSDPGVLLLFDKILRAALFWFRDPPRYYAKGTRREAGDAVAALAGFLQGLRQGTWPSYSPGESAVHPVWGSPDPAVSGYVRLLRFMLEAELSRLNTWVDPRRNADASSGSGTPPWRDLLLMAWQVSPQLALGVWEHFPGVTAAQAELEFLVLKSAFDPAIQALPAGALLVASAERAAANAPVLAALAVWAPGTAEQGLQLLAGPAGSHPAVRSYAMRCLFAARPERVVFFLPQLVQLLRGDKDGQVMGLTACGLLH